MIRQLALILLLICSLFTFKTFSQTSLAHYDQDLNFNKGLSFFEEGRYGSARQFFKKSMDAKENSATLQAGEAEYYHALSAKMLGNSDAEELFLSFLDHHPESARIHYAYFRIGEIYSDNNKFRQAIRWFQKVKPTNLDTKTRNIYYFKTGYANFACEKDDEALTYFSKMKGSGDEYEAAANYYTSHIQYAKGNYQTALNGFLKLKSDPTFKDVIPYYIAQIYFLQKEYDKAIEFGLPLFEKSNGMRKADIARVVGGAYYQKGNYKEAITYLRGVVEMPNFATREDQFHLGYALYTTQKYDEAVKNLLLVTSENDLMTQNAYFYLGDCYIQLNDKKRARSAFESASRLNYDSKIQEEALFNSLKLNYELAYSPFNEIITSFTNFINLFPNSPKIDEAYDYLSKTFLNTKNYPMAIESLEKIKKKDATIYRSIQRVAYYRGLQLFNDVELADAINMFNYSLKYPDYDKTLKVKAIYWRGETKYKLGDLEGAVADYNLFLTTPGSFTLAEFAMAYYNIGYAYFNQKDYANAQQSFRKFISTSAQASSPVIADAYNRLGDCYFAVRDFDMAMDCYNKSLTNGGSMPDYALYQKGIALGISKRNQEKVQSLNELIQKYPKSNYVPDALYESARTYTDLNNLQESIVRYKTIKEKYPQSIYAKKALQQLGLVYYNSGDLNNSLTYFKRVVNEYPGSPESDEALAGIRNIYVDKGDLNEYYAYTKSLGNYVKIEVNEQDSLAFVTAEKLYMAGKCDAAIQNFENYLQQFPDGKYLLHAHFYKADCLYRNGNLEKAYNDYNAVVLRGRSEFAEESLVKCATYLFNKENYQEALPLYSRLNNEAVEKENKVLAKLGVMRCANKLNNYEEAIAVAQSLKDQEKLEPDLEREINFTLATGYRNTNQNDQALAIYKDLAKNTNSNIGSEAKYWVCQSYFNANILDKAEAEVFDYAKKGTANPYWLARSFIVLSDVYLKKNDTYQAKQYLESVKENYKGQDDILDMVNSRLEKMAQPQSKPKPRADFMVE